MCTWNHLKYLHNFFEGKNDPEASLDAMEICTVIQEPFKLRPKFQNPQMAILAKTQKELP